MLMGALVYGIKYALPEYICNFFIGGGVPAFALYKTSSKAISKLAHLNAPYGYGLCFLNLIFDDLTNATQDYFKRKYATDYAAVSFCKEHSEVAWDILMFYLYGAVGQNFIFFTINSFGSRSCQYYHHDDSQVSKHCSILFAEWESSISKAMSGHFHDFLGLPYNIFL
ncbi:UDP-galactose/UDP-glucose transporter 3 [Dendrobium catenatum]|uniref:UDP-galactose/UDP-glucose transporter 3 n=1 Tax=Dendrobium catenatum TaxID=906689 RepID=A0A2I0WXY7_9ASPA|nr:UDP-galactose/UDP-glucose transporter 3 [Dendrobium catenatum]